MWQALRSGKFEFFKILGHPVSDQLPPYRTGALKPFPSKVSTYEKLIHGIDFIYRVSHQYVDNLRLNYENWKITYVKKQALF